MNRNLQKRRAAVKLSMESYADTAGVELAPVVAASVGPVSLEPPVSDLPNVTANTLNDIREELEESYDLDAVERLNGVTKDLTRIHDQIESSLPEGGLTPREASAFRTAADIAVADTGVGIGDSMPSQESFKSSVDRMEATRLSMEGIMDRIKKVGKKTWEVIVKMVKRVIEHLSSFSAKIRESIRRMDSGYAALKDYADRKVTIDTTENDLSMITVNGAINPAQAFRWYDTVLLPYSTLALPILEKDLNMIIGSASKLRSSDFAGYEVALKHITFDITAGVDGVAIAETSLGKGITLERTGNSTTKATLDVRQIIAMRDKAIRSFQKQSGLNWSTLIARYKTLSENAFYESLETMDTLMQTEGSKKNDADVLSDQITALLTLTNGVYKTTKKFVESWEHLIIMVVREVKASNNAEPATA